MAGREPSSYVPSFARGLSILAVDEDEVFLACLAQMLETLTFNVVTTVKGTEAVTMICEQRDRFKLVLASVTLSDVKCTTFLRFLLGKKIPLVVMFPQFDVSGTMQLLSRGAMLCLDKPVSIGDLKNIWQQAFRKRIIGPPKTLNVAAPPLPPPITTPPLPPTTTTTTNVSNPPSSAAEATTPVSGPRGSGIAIGKEQGEVAPGPNGPTVDPNDGRKTTSSVPEKRKGNKIPIKRRYIRENGWVHHEMMKREKAQKEQRMRNSNESPSASATLPLQEPESDNSNGKDNNNIGGGSETRGNENERASGEGSVRIYGGRRKLKKNSSKKNDNGEKRARMIWTGYLQTKFARIMNFLGPDRLKVKPNTVLDLMQEPTLTLSQVASHLQKYKSMVRENREVRNARLSNFHIPSQDNIFHQQYGSIPYNFVNANGIQGNEVWGTSFGQQQHQYGSGNVGDVFVFSAEGNQTTGPQVPFGEQQLGAGNMGDAFVFSANCNAPDGNSTSTYSAPVPLTQTNGLDPYMPSGSQKTVSQATTLGEKQGLGSESSYARLIRSGYRNIGLSRSFGQSHWRYSSGQQCNSGLVPSATILPSATSHLNGNYLPNYFSGHQNTVPDMTFGQSQGAVASAEGNYNPSNVPNTLMFPTSTTDVNIDTSPAFTSGQTSILSPMPPNVVEDLAAAVEKFLSEDSQDSPISPNSSNINESNLPSLHPEQSQVLEQIHPSHSTNEPVLPTNFMNRSWDTVEVASPTENLRERVSNLTLDSPAQVEEDDFQLDLEYLFKTYGPVSPLDPPPPQSQTETQLQPQLNIIQVEQDSIWNLNNEFPLLDLGDQVPILEPLSPQQNQTETQLQHPSNVIESSWDTAEEFCDGFSLVPEDYSELMESAAQRNNLYP